MTIDPNWLANAAKDHIWGQRDHFHSFEDALAIVSNLEEVERRIQFAQAAHIITNEVPSTYQDNAALLDLLFCAGASTDWRDYPCPLAGNVHKTAFECDGQWNEQWEHVLRVMDAHGYDIDEGGQWSAWGIERGFDDAVSHLQAVKEPKRCSEALNQATPHVAARSAARRM